MDANVMICELQQLQGSGTAGAEIQEFDTNPSVLFGKPMTVMSPGRWHWRSPPGRMVIPGHCSPWGFCILLNSSPANAADVFSAFTSTAKRNQDKWPGAAQSPAQCALDTLAPPHGVLWLKSAAPAQPRLGWVIGILGHTPWRGGCSKGDVWGQVLWNQK